MEELLEKKNLTKEDRKEISNVIRHVQTHIGANTPFMLEIFQEATEKVVTHAKAEIDAFMTHNIITEGIRSITEKSQKQLVDHEDVKPVELPPKSNI